VLTRFSLFVIVRAQVSDRELLRRSLAVEAAMEELALVAGLDPTLAGLAGLGAGLDAQLCERNPSRRGALAEEMLRTEGAPVEVAAAVRQCWREADVPALAPLAAALVASHGLIDQIYAVLETDEKLGFVEAAAVAMTLERKGRRGDEPTAARVLACLARLGVTPAAAAELALRGMDRVREDLQL